MKNETTSIFRAEKAPLNITFVVLPGASIMCVAASIDPLRAANRISGETLYQWRLVSPDGQNIETTSGIAVAVSGRLDASQSHEVVAVIGGFGTSALARGPALSALRKAARAARAFGGIEAGSWLLGHAGLLENRVATTHWEDMDDFAAAFPATDVRPDRYVIDGNLFTTGGASPTFDLMLHLISARQGTGLALNVASVFIYDQIRSASDAQPLVSLGRLGIRDPRVAGAIRLMQAHVTAPLPIAIIASRVGASQRTLELEFGRLIGEPPGRYYLGLRLAAARKMVTDTALAMTEIAARTGFSSTATFARAFRAQHGMAARQLRRR